jgi:hypothetical protein
MSQVSDPNADVDRVDLQSLDVAEQKRQELLRLFPEVCTEGGKIDFDRSTAGVLATTRATAAAEGLSVTLIPTWYDVDTVSDLERALGAWDASSPPSGGARHLRAWATQRRPSSLAASRMTRCEQPKDEA